MGCLLSMDEFKPNPRIPGQGPEIYNIFDILELDSYAINVLYSCFVEIDVDKGGTVVLPELYSFLNRERSAFYDACFAVFDDDNSGQIDFVEFVCCMWFLCTLPLGLVGGFAFAVCDVDESDSISMEEIVRLFELMYPKGGSFDIINDLKNDNNVENSLTMDSFLAWTKGKPGTIAPAAKLQRVLQTNIGGASFWVNLSANRQIHRSPTMRHPKAMKPIRNALRELKAGYAELRVKAEHKKVIKLSEENQQHRNNSDNLLRVLMGVGAQKPRGGKYAADIPMRRPKTAVVASKTPVVAPGGLLIPGAVPTCVPDRSKDGVNPYLDKLADDAEKKIRRSVKRAKKESTRKALLKVSMKAQVTGVHDSNDINISIPPDMGSPGGVTTSPKRDRPMSAKASTKGNGNESPSRKIRPLSASNISPSGTPGRPRSALMTPPREDMLERQASSKRLVGREWNKRG